MEGSTNHEMILLQVYVIKLSTAPPRSNLNSSKRFCFSNAKSNSRYSMVQRFIDQESMASGL